MGVGWAGQSGRSICRALPDRGRVIAGFSKAIYGEACIRRYFGSKRCRIARPGGGRAMPGSALRAP